MYKRKEFRVMVVKVIQELREWTHRARCYKTFFNKELENIKNNQVELKNTIILVKKNKKLEGINNRISEAEE